MAFELPPLPYDYAALEPTIDEATMKLHHDKHHQAYVTNLNGAVEKHPELGKKTPEELIKNFSRQIMLLEQEVGVSLLDRGGRTVKLTPAGRVFLAEARRILRLAEESTLAVRRIPTGTGGTLVA